MPDEFLYFSVSFATFFFRASSFSHAKVHWKNDPKKVTPNKINKTNEWKIAFLFSRAPHTHIRITYFYFRPVAFVGVAGRLFHIINVWPAFAKKNIIYAKMETKQSSWWEPKKFGCTSTTIQSSISRHAIAAYCLFGRIRMARAQGYPIERCSDARSTHRSVSIDTENKNGSRCVDGGGGRIRIRYNNINREHATNGCVGGIFVHIGYCLCFLFRASHHLHAANGARVFCKQTACEVLSLRIGFCCRLNVTWMSYWISV